MARSLNRAEIIGYLGSDPEIKYLNSGDAVASFSVATTDAWTDKDGQRQERTEWHKVVAWRKLAEICSQYLKKGMRVFIAGKIQTDKWEKDGATHYSTKIVAGELLMLGTSRTDGTEAEHTPTSYPQPNGPASPGDDLPF